MPAPCGLQDTVYSWVSPSRHPHSPGTSSQQNQAGLNSPDPAHRRETCQGTLLPALSSLHGVCRVLGRGGTGLTHRGTPGGFLGEGFLFQPPFPAGGRLASEGGGAAAPRKAAASVHSLKSSHTSNRAARACPRFP